MECSKEEESTLAELGNGKRPEGEKKSPEEKKKLAILGGLLAISAGGIGWALSTSDKAEPNPLTLSKETTPEDSPPDLSVAQLPADATIRREVVNDRQRVELPSQEQQAVAVERNLYHQVKVVDNQYQPIPNARVRVALPPDPQREAQIEAMREEFRQRFANQRNRGNGNTPSPQANQGQNRPTRDITQSQRPERREGRRGRFGRSNRGLLAGIVLDLQTDENGIAKIELEPERLETIQRGLERLYGEPKALFPGNFELAVSHQYHIGTRTPVEIADAVEADTEVPETVVVLQAGLTARGQVVDRESRVPVANALLRIGSKLGTTDENGFIRERNTEDLLDGVSGFDIGTEPKQDLLIDAKGYPPAELQIDLNQFNTIEISKIAAAVQLVLQDKFTGRPIVPEESDIRVSLSKETEEGQRSLRRSYHRFEYGDDQNEAVTFQGNLVTLGELPSEPAGRITLTIPGYDRLTLNISELKEKNEGYNTIELRPLLERKILLRELVSADKEPSNRPPQLELWQVNQNGEREQIRFFRGGRTPAKVTPLENGQAYHDYELTLSTRGMRLNEDWSHIEVSGLRQSRQWESLTDENGAELTRPIDVLNPRNPSSAEDAPLTFLVKRRDQ